MSGETFSGFNVLFRRDTAANWASVNPILGNFEPGGVTVNGVQILKMGDGVTAWNDLPFYQPVIYAPQAPIADPSVTRFFLDTTGVNITIDIKNYVNVAVYKDMADVTAATITIVDTTPRDVNFDPLSGSGEGLHLVLNEGSWYRE